jgi:hypothetical protein
MLELLDQELTSQVRQDICQAFHQYSQRLANSLTSSDGGQVADCEKMVAANPRDSFQVDAQGMARLTAGRCDFSAGRFACRSLTSLRSAQPKGGRVSLWVLEGQANVTDIGALQAIAPPKSLFQVASQFNCLESPGPRLAKVADYFFDPTQGPRASISAYPATLLRHYRAPGPEGTTFVQQDDGPQLNLLHRVALEGVARVEGGYLLAHQVTQPATLATLVQEHFDEIEVGVHENVQVVLGADWGGAVIGKPHIAQVFTSTVAAGGYSRVDLSNDNWLIILRQIQRAAYLGTLLAAAKLRQRRAILTLIGGGVFGNPLPLIWDSILWACRQVEAHLDGDLTVIVNGRNLSSGVALEKLREAAQKRGGDLLYCTNRGISFEQ